MAAEMIIEIVNSYLGGRLFHKTDEANFPSINEHGLLSKEERVVRGIAPVNPGGSPLTWYLDGKHGLNGYVFVGFHKYALMPKHDDDRWRRPSLLHIDPRVLHLRGVKISIGRANHRGMRRYAPAYAFGKMDWEAWPNCFDENDISLRERSRRVWDYEILVPTCVPREYILGSEQPS